jgi:uncharacterized protein YuzE
MNIIFSDAEITENDEAKPGVIIDYDKDGNIVVIEILDASKKTDAAEKVEYEFA